MAEIRRVVAATDHQGKSVIVSDGPAPFSHDFAGMPGQAQTRIWFSANIPAAAGPDEEPTDPNGPVVPGAGGASFVVVQYAPDSVVTDPRFRPDLLSEELATYAPDLAAAFEADDAGMHRTPSVDYGVVIEGEIWLELDDGVEAHLRPGDTVVQLGTRHAWRNKTDRAAVVAFVITGMAG
jgi:hypothetical protein